MDRESAPRVVVAEDDTEMRRLVTEALRADDYEVVESNSGGDLLVRITEQYRSGRAIDLLVTDVRMPVSNGLVLVEAMRAAHWKTPVIVMTAFGDEQTRQRAEAAGARLLCKPFKMSELREMARRLLGR